MKRLLLGIGLMVLPGLALAQPLLVPGSDVSVTYRVGGAAAAQIPGATPHDVQLQWDAAGQRLRAEPLGGPVYAIVDLSQRLADVVFPGQMAVLELPLRRGDPQSLLGAAGMAFTRRGIATVLGQPCTEWSVHSRKLDGAGCVTADGIVLRAQGLFDGQAGDIQALSIVRGRVPPRQFIPPEGFFRLPMMGGR